MSKLDLVVAMIAGLGGVGGWAFHFLLGRIDRVADMVMSLGKVVGNHHEHRLAKLEQYVGIEEPDTNEEG